MSELKYLISNIHLKHIPLKKSEYRLLTMCSPVIQSQKDTSISSTKYI